MYELWDIETGNWVATFGHRRDALTAVRRMLTAHGPAYVESLSLARSGSATGGATIAQGRGLLRLVQQVDVEADPKAS
jgi:hypothetical protein